MALKKYIIVTAVILLLFIAASLCVSAGNGEYNLVASYDIASGLTYEQAEANFRDYIASYPDSIRNASWKVGQGSSSFSFERIHPAGDKWMTQQTSLSYEVPDTLIPGQKAKISYTVTGDLSNMPPEWNPVDTWVASFDICAYSGNDGAALSVIGQGNPTTYVNLANKSVSGVYEFDVPKDLKYVVINVIHGTNILGGIGKSYTYEIDGKPIMSEPTENKPKNAGSTERLEFEPEGLPVGARIDNVWGTVEIADSDSDALAGNWGFLRPGMELKGGMVIKTGEDSGCIISWNDGEVQTLKSESFLRIRPLIKQLVGFQKWLYLKYGSVKINASNIIKGKNAPLVDLTETPDYQAMIKGTIYICESDGVSSTLKVLEGEVECVSSHTGQSVLLGAGEAVYADTSGLADKTSFDTDTVKSEWEDIEKKLDGNKSITLLIIIPAVVLLMLIIVGFIVTAGRSKSKRPVT